MPPSLNVMEGTGREARERREGVPQEEGKGQKGKVERAIKFKGLEASQFSSFHRACVSSVGCSNAGGKLGTPREYHLGETVITDVVFPSEPSPPHNSHA